MKKAKTLWLGITQIIVTCFMIPMYFVKYIHEVAVIPDMDGVINRTDHYYSAYDKLGRAGYGFVVWAMIIIAAVSIALYIRNIVRDEKFNKNYIIAFIIQIVVFLFIMFIFAPSFGYHY